jgi:hypothetical protein
MANKNVSLRNGKKELRLFFLVFRNIKCVLISIESRNISLNEYLYLKNIFKN